MQVTQGDFIFTTQVILNRSSKVFYTYYIGESILYTPKIIIFEIRTGKNNLRIVLSMNAR